MDFSSAFKADTRRGKKKKVKAPPKQKNSSEPGTKYLAAVEEH